MPTLSDYGSCRRCSRLVPAAELMRGGLCGACASPTAVAASLDMEAIVHQVVEAGAADWLRGRVLDERQKGDLDVLARVGEQLNPPQAIWVALDDGTRRIVGGKLALLKAWLKRLGEHVRRNDGRALARGRSAVMGHLRELHEAIVRQVAGAESKAAASYGSRVLAANGLLGRLQLVAAV